jgi:hypothetical protein
MTILLGTVTVSPEPLRRVQTKCHSDRDQALGSPQKMKNVGREQLWVPHTPDFLWSFVGSLIFMRLSLKERRTR